MQIPRVNSQLQQISCNFGQKEQQREKNKLARLPDEIC